MQVLVFKFINEYFENALQENKGIPSMIIKSYGLLEKILVDLPYKLQIKFENQFYTENRE